MIFFHEGEIWSRLSHMIRRQFSLRGETLLDTSGLRNCAICIQREPKVRAINPIAVPILFKVYFQVLLFDVSEQCLQGTESCTKAKHSNSIPCTQILRLYYILRFFVLISIGNVTKGSTHSCYCIFAWRIFLCYWKLCPVINAELSDRETQEDKSESLSCPAACPCTFQGWLFWNLLIWHKYSSRSTT